MRCLLVVAVLGACMDRPQIAVDKPTLDLPLGAASDLAVSEGGEPLADAIWLVDDPTIASVTRTDDGERLRVGALAEGKTAVHVGSHGVVVHIPVHVAPPAIVQMWIEPPAVTTTVGAMVPVRATAVDTTSAIVDVTAETGWQLMDPSVATLDDANVLGTALGHTVLRAALAGTQSEISITVE